MLKMAYFSRKMTKTDKVKEQKDDMNVYEASMRAQMMAETKGLKEITQDLVKFLEGIP